MHVSEFKAWFKGFTENLSGLPNKKQWERIKKQIASIDESPISPIVIQRYYPEIWRKYYVDSGIYWNSNHSLRSSAPTYVPNITCESQRAQKAWTEGHLQALTEMGRHDSLHPTSTLNP